VRVESGATPKSYLHNTHDKVAIRLPAFRVRLCWSISSNNWENVSLNIIINGKSCGSLLQWKSEIMDLMLQESSYAETCSMLFAIILASHACSK